MSTASRVGQILRFPVRRLPLALQARHLSHETQFMPAALEIVETPAPPAGRIISVTIMATFTAAVAWACIGHVDIIATASGRVIPSGKTKTIQPFETGVVRAIHVRDGDVVKAGDVLVELDPTINEADRDRSAADLAAAELTVARLRAALAGDLKAFIAPKGAGAAQLLVQRGLVESQLNEYRAKLAALQGEHAQRLAERAGAAASMAKIQAMLPIQRERTEIRRKLLENEFGSRLNYLTELNDLTNQEHELLVEQQKLQQANAAILANERTLDETKATFQKGLLTDLADAEQKAAGLRQDLLKASQRTQLQRLTAPVAGQVQQLALTTVGGVVTPAQALMAIVPVDSKLEIEAMVDNKDIGFVHPGDEAEIKVETFTFTRYGLLHGRVVSLSQDAIQQDTFGRSGADPATDKQAPDKPKLPQLAYAARVSLDRTTMRIEDKELNLGPGMAVTVEIKTGRRRLIDYLLSPVMRYRHESGRER